EITAEDKGMPLAGTVAAGLTTLGFEQAERVDFGQMFSKKSFFALKVKGDSMIDAHIADGDYVIVKKQRTGQLLDVADLYERSQRHGDRGRCRSQRPLVPI